MSQQVRCITLKVFADSVIRHDIEEFSEKDWKVDRKDEEIVRDVYLVTHRKIEYCHGRIPRWWACYDFED